MGLYAELRAEYGPVAPVLLPGDVEAWLVLGYRENVEVARNHYLFSRDSRIWREHKRLTPDHPLAPLTAWQPLCSFADGAEHRRLRGTVMDSLARFNHRGIRRYITRSADDLIDRFCEAGKADLVEDFGEHLPMMVMAQLLGIPEDEGPALVEAVREMFSGSAKAGEANEYITTVLGDLLERAHRRPQHDLASRMIEHAAGLDDDSLLQHLRLVLVAAHATTASLIVDSTRVLLSDERFRGNLQGGHMRLPDALEQVLWDYPPFITITGRWATTDTMLADQQIRAGDMLVLGLAAANTDPAVRPNLSAPVIGNRSHLSFGAGDHTCPGQHIARAIADSGISTLLRRLPDVELAVGQSELTWHATLLTRRLTELPITFTPRPRGVGDALVWESAPAPAGAGR
ncbi:cytochrome P450 [Streptomyces sp. YIM 98790]|uniref:cytochrome P450 n=1 Tax=Streptomyces sp. YIM 98790 TaxID=2689077 RepID=UPI00140BB062|nr:cytochrome P450 [Streptomyces sp. YIM 98790]